MPRIALATIAALALLHAQPLLAADVAGSKDHPMISRYEGSEIIKYQQQAYQSARLVQGPVSQRGGLAKNPAASLALEGKLTRIAYKAPAGRSVLEVYRTYEQALQAAGFTLQFSCENETCSPGQPNGRPFNEAATPPDLATLMGYHEKDQRYLLAKLARAGGDVYASLYLNRAYSIGGVNKDRVFANLVVVETQPMQTGMVKVDATAMAKGLDGEGRIALYEIYFETDQAELKSESATALAEIAKLLEQQPALQVLIVGHTDNVGKLDYNRALSERRARAVAEALATQHGIARARLTPVGGGMAAPLASNAAEPGRAKNRRVELVKR
jgi:outer membrane protein OmpA-like peptidoglycan-associated protein